MARKKTELSRPHRLVGQWQKIHPRPNQRFLYRTKRDEKNNIYTNYNWNCKKTLHIQKKNKDQIKISNIESQIE